MRLESVVQLEKQGFIPPNWQASTRLQSPAALNTGPLLDPTKSDMSERGIFPSVLYSSVFVNSTSGCSQPGFCFNTAGFIWWDVSGATLVTLVVVALDIW